MTGFREDGYAAVDWAADYLERVGELPVLAQVDAGRALARGCRVAAGAGASRSRTCSATSTS